ncbi:GNAT family N-acetyltransferase [Brevundimonas lutea]|uniref:GNAT family N-acetyltransferase n=1 Tax=Brevundimonas lutea TaxID=2293980 RepID=UPI0013CF17FD|nr:GNAT family N-acetyltransferase [Brevundimonas lutea]
MSSMIQVEIVAPGALSPADAAAWDALRAAGGLDHPYFDRRFVEAAAGVPGGRVALFRREGRLVGAFPHQRRGRLIQPLAAPMSDYHGVIAAPDAGLDARTVARLLGGQLRFGGWMSAADGEGLVARERMATNVTGGAETLNTWLDGINHKFFKNLRRMRRGFEKAHGEARLVWDDRDPAVLDWIIGMKRDQYRRTRRHDVFACGWTGDLLHRLMAMRAADETYGLRVASLRTATGEIAAAEASLDDGRTLHLWFPTYDVAFSKFGPGMLLTWMEMEKAAEAGYARVDFGCGEEGYKSTLAQSVGTVLEGTVMGGSPGLLPSAARWVGEVGPAPLRRLGQSVGRRLDIINACETRPADWWAGAARAAVAAARKSTAGAAA